MSSYMRFLSEKDHICYLSPAEVRSLKNKLHNPKAKPEKSDVFSLGMTLLEASTLSDVQECYNFKKYTVSR